MTIENTTGRAVRAESLDHETCPMIYMTIRQSRKQSPLSIHASISTGTQQARGCLGCLKSSDKVELNGVK